MVRSRSETNLNRIFYDLYLSPEARSKHQHIRSQDQRKSEPPLPTLKPIKSISCSDLTQASENPIAPPSIDESELESLDLTIPLKLPPLTRKGGLQVRPAAITPLVPIESTGFAIQPIPTTLINSATKVSTHLSAIPIHSPQFHSSFHYEKSHATLPASPTSPVDKKQQDYTSRLRDRLKSRNHLRTFFLS